MSVPLMCICVGMVLPFIWAFSTAPFRTKQLGRFDLQTPRHQGEQLTGAGARAVGAQGNAWEALILFSAANLGAFMTGVDPEGHWTMAAIIWVGARLGHGIFYLMDLAPLRIAAFVIGTGMSFWIMVMALSQ